MDTELTGSQIVGRQYVCNSTNYQLDEYERLSDVKRRQRDKILNFILKNHSDTPIRYLGMPGKYWFLENQIVNISKASVSGVENNLKIYRNSRFMMPGRHKVIDKSKDINKNIKLDIHVNNKSVYLYGNLSDMTGDDVHQLLIDESGTFKFGFTERTAIWYDFTASFNEKTFTAIHNIKNVVNKAINPVVCFTLMYGRDLYFNGSSEDSRVDIIKTALPGFEPLDIWQYKGFNDTNMINICGILK